MARSKSPFQTSEAVDNIGIESAVATIQEEPQTSSLPRTAGAVSNPTVNPATTAVPVEFMTQLLAMFAEKMNEGLSKVLVAARTAPVDPIKEAQRERAKKTKEETEAAYWSGLVHRSETCNHTRADLTSNICFATQSDGIRRGICARCQTMFSPRRNECISDAVHASYKDVIKIPYSREGGGVVYI